MKCQDLCKPILTICVCFLTTSCANDFFILSGIEDEAKLMNYVEPMELKMLEKTFNELPSEVQGAVENSAKIVTNRQITQFSKITDFMKSESGGDDEVEAIIQESADELLDVMEESLVFAKENVDKKTPKQIERHIVNSTSPKVQYIHFRLKQRLNRFQR